METPMYDTLSSDYDRFVNWQNRLAVELPFIIEKLQVAGARTILDAACGTGMHAIALAQCGFTTCGADLSQGMIDRAIANASSAGVTVHFELAGFGALAQTFGIQAFDAILCLGNSLPHLLTLPELTSALTDFAACVKPGSLLLVQNRNFDAIMSNHQRWMEPQAHTEGATEYLFQRFYDFDPDGLITFNMVTLKRVGDGNWSQSVTTSRLRPLLKDELVTELKSAGFADIKNFGNMAGVDFDQPASPNLVMLARLPSSI
jgi:glycine/sarcosine N-methyltransferase